MTRIDYREALTRTGVMEALQPYDPHIAGTPPLGLDLPGSDIDILCHAPDPARFAQILWDRFADCADFRVWQWSRDDRPVLAGFAAHGWQFEIFGQAKPVSQQAGWRHFIAERLLLALGGPRLADVVMKWRRTGLKTEPAFAAALRLKGDPYRRLLDLAESDDAELSRLIDDTR
ncbi:MAG: phage capsid protein [Croceicoccus sp.]|nr:phage capsid protein [Croceicoccus sp.]